MIIIPLIKTCILQSSAHEIVVTIAKNTYRRGVQSKRHSLPRANTRNPGVHCEAMVEIVNFFVGD